MQLGPTATHFCVLGCVAKPPCWPVRGGVWGNFSQLQVDDYDVHKSLDQREQEQFGASDRRDRTRTHGRCE